MPAENLKVAVRVRGFNDREREMGCKLVVQMNGNTTTVLPTGNDTRSSTERRFAFDYSYWSHDGFKIENDGYLSPDASSSRYIDQKRVFNDLGLNILSNAWDGYNASVFAYGQTGSGKSYSMVGSKANKGMTPLLVEGLFEQINKEKSTKDNQLEVTFSMIEIYNEVARDLLTKKADRKGLPIHERPGRGFHIMEQDLKPTPICDYVGFEKLMEQGNANKIIAATKMNATSSRAHTIIEIQFKQTYTNEVGKEMQRISIINLIDLAGSERTDKSGTSGDRLKEGIAINKSLTSLGNCIEKLAEAANGKDVKIPYRDSILTKLLMNALGGNSKTVMIAAISPADNNYDETISTLRYADRAKQIKTNAKVNEDPKDLLIRQLQEEINTLKQNIKTGGVIENPDNLSKAEYEKLKREMEDNMKKQIEESEKEIQTMKKTYEEKLIEAQAKAKEIAKYNVNEKASSLPHLSNISSDPMLTGSLKHLFETTAKKTKFILGNSDKCDIQLFGLGIQDRHAGVTLEDGKFYLEPYVNARVVRNGKTIEQKFRMENLDRYVFGASLYYIFVNPPEFTADGTHAVEVMNEKVSKITVQQIQTEIAHESGLIDESDLKKDNPDEIACINELIDLLPNIEEANQMSILLDKKIIYKAAILHPLLVGDIIGKIRPVIILKKFGTSLEWMWDKFKFIDRKSFMSEMYADLKEGVKLGEHFKNFDPFVENELEPVLMGTAVFEPISILHNVPFQESVKIYDYKNRLAGTMNIQLVPCDKNGNVYTDIGSSIIHKPETQLKELYFIIKMDAIRSMQPKFRNIFCKYRLYGEDDDFKTESGKDTNNPDLNHERLISYDKSMLSYEAVRQGLIKYYSTSPIYVKVYGVQKVISTESNKLSTKEWFDKDRKEKQIVKKDDSKEEIEKLKATLQNLNTLLDFAEKKKNKSRIRIDYVRECLLSSKPDVLTKLLEKINKAKEEND